ncbi:MAG: translocation/assembly module TamB domain-containing protein [Pseudomonadota bacterium]
MKRILVILLLCAATVPAAAQLSFLGLKNQMVQFLLDQLSTEGEFEITADEVVEPEDGVTAITGLKIADREGIWLTADNLNFTWNPSRLLRGEVEFSNLALVGVKVMRAPVPADAPAEEETEVAPADFKIAWPRAPLTVRIDRMALEDVEIAEPVLGHAIAFTAEGMGRDEGDVQAIAINITRDDAVEGVIKLDYEHNFAEGTLRLILDAKEGPNGLIAALSGLPSEAPTTAVIDAEGPPEDWRMDLDIRLAETLEMTGKAAISYAGPLKIDAQISAAPGPRLDPNLAALLGERAELIARAAEGEDGVLLIEAGELRAPDIDLEASGTYTRPTGAADLAVVLEARSGLAAPIEGVDFGGLLFDGNITGTPGTFSAQGDLGLTELKTAPVDFLAASLTVDVQQSPMAESDDTQTRFDIRGATEGLRLDKIAPGVLGAPNLMIAGELTGPDLMLEALTLASEVLTLDLAGTANLESQDADLTLSITAPNIAPVAAAYGQTIEGAISAEGKASHRSGEIDLAAEAALEGLRHALADARSLSLAVTALGSAEAMEIGVEGRGQALRLDKIPPELLGTVRFDGGAKIAGETLTLAPTTLLTNLLDVELAGELQMDGSAGEVDYILQTASLGPITELYGVALDANASIEGRATLRPGAPQIVGTAALNDVVFDATSYGDLALDHDVSLGSAPAGQLDLGLTNSPYGDITAATGFLFEAPALTLSDLSASALGLALKGGLVVQTDRALADGEFALTAGSLRPLSALAGTQLGGALKGKIALTHAEGQQAGRATLTGTNLSAATASLSRLDLDARLGDVLGVPQLDTILKIAGLTAEPVEMEAITLTARGPLSALQVETDGAGTMGKDPLTLNLAAQVDGQGPDLGANITRLEAALAEEALSLAAPLEIRANGDTVQVSEIDLMLPRDGRLTGNLRKTGQSLIGELALANLDAELARRFGGAPILGGRLSAQAGFNTGRGPAVFTLDGQEIKFEGVEDAGALTLDVDGDWDGRTASINSQITGPFGQPLRARLSAPVRPGLIPQLATRGPISGVIDWQGEIGKLWALVPAPGHILSGQTVVALGITGDISDPELAGDIQISDGSYQNLDAGTILTDLTLGTQITPEGDLTFALNASDGVQGTLKTDGTIALDQSGIEIRTLIDKAVLIRRDYVSARIDGDILVKGPVDGLNVGGEIILETVEVRLVSSASADIADLGEVKIKGAEDPPEPGGESTTTLDLDITAPGRVFVRGRGLDSQWKVGMQVRGSTAAPVVTGKVESVRGVLELIGKTFDLEESEVSFDGRIPIDPRIDITFERETSDLTGRILVTGRGSDPKLSFSSSPSLPEDEVLPQTLFGKSSQALTGSQAIQLALGLATLMDGGDGTIDKLRGAVGLDQLRVEQDEDGNAALAAGKEVSEGVFVGAKQGLTGGDSAVIVEVEVFEDINLDAEIGADSEPTVGIRWKRDF